MATLEHTRENVVASGFTSHWSRQSGHWCVIRSLQKDKECIAPLHRIYLFSWQNHIMYSLLFVRWWRFALHKISRIRASGRTT